jgi:hypothetical protein
MTERTPTELLLEQTQQQLIDALAYLDKAGHVMSMMLTVHRHEPIFSADDEAMAHAFVTEWYSRKRKGEGLHSLPTTEDRQAKTIEDLTEKVQSLTAEVKMLREYELEICQLLNESDRVAKAAHEELQALAGHTNPAITRRIEAFLTNAEREATAFLNDPRREEDAGVTTLHIVTKPDPAPTGPDLRRQELRTESMSAVQANPLACWCRVRSSV